MEQQSTSLPPQWQVIRAQPADLPVLQQLLARDLWQAEHHTLIPTPRWCQRLLQIGLLLLLTNRGQLVAACGVIPVHARSSAQHQRCLWLCRRSYRRRGWGRLLQTITDRVASEIWGSTRLLQPPTDVYLVPISPEWALSAGLGRIPPPSATGLALQTAHHADAEQILRALATQLAGDPEAPRLDDSFYCQYLRSLRDVQATYVRRQGEIVTDMVSISYLHSTHLSTGQTSRVAVLRYHYSTSVPLGHLLDTLLHYLAEDGVVALAFPETLYHGAVALTGCQLGVQVSGSTVYPLLS